MTTTINPGPVDLLASIDWADDSCFPTYMKRWGRSGS